MDVESLRKKKQKNVQEQNAVLKDSIRRCAARFEAASSDYAWLRQALRDQSVKVETGMLCELGDILEQAGVEWHGLWLTETKRFFSFSFMRAYSGGTVEVEEWRDTTDGLVVTGRGHGTGKSFAYLALEVFEERQGA